IHAPHHTYFQAQGAYLAVDVFFALSGFVLAHSYERKLLTDLSLVGFMRIRLRRLYPLYFLALVVGGLIALGRGEDVTAAFTTGLLFLPAPQGDVLFPLNVPAWSLFFELVINFAYALTIRFLTNRALGVIIAAGAVAVVALALSYGGMDVGWGWANWPVGL